MEIVNLMNHYKFADDHRLESIINDWPNMSIYQEVLHSLNCTKAIKATDIDGIPDGCYKYGSDEQMALITALFNCIFESGIYPDQWCGGDVNIIQKQGPRLSPENYRKTTVSPSIGKIFDTFLIVDWHFYRRTLNEEGKFQNGFNEKSRTIDYSFLLNGIIEEDKALSSPLLICYVDFIQVGIRLH